MDDDLYVVYTQKYHDIERYDKTKDCLFDNQKKILSFGKTSSKRENHLLGDQKDDQKRITRNLIKIFQKLENSVIFHVV